jgi:hypothetical protein
MRGDHAMTESELGPRIRREPFQPYRLLLTEGETILVKEPKKVVMSGGQLAVVGSSRAPNRAGRCGLRIVPLHRIQSVEDVDAGTVNG